MKLNRVLVLEIAAVVILIGSSISIFFSLHHHSEFFSDMRAFQREVQEFMAPGDRNTADHGYGICTRLNTVTRPVDCCTLYYPNAPDRCNQ